ncbi:MAG: hypothetical protein HKN77_09070 [Woeseiaceae bacterium]|nr:hypothetical protein [Woeseiaceae bacterium]
MTSTALNSFFKFHSTNQIETAEIISTVPPESVGHESSWQLTMFSATSVRLIGFYEKQITRDIDIANLLSGG